MPIATTTEIRTLTGWSAAVTDPRLSPHLLAASRELRTWIGADLYDEIAARSETSGADDDKRNAAYIEACLTIAYVIPTLNTFASADGPIIPKKIEDAEMQFLTPEQADTLAQTWMGKAEKAYRGWTWKSATDTSGTARPSIAWGVV